LREPSKRRQANDADAGNSNANTAATQKPTPRKPALPAVKQNHDADNSGQRNETTTATAD
jgi:hypothetical protein